MRDAGFVRWTPPQLGGWSSGLVDSCVARSETCVWVAPGIGSIFSGINGVDFCEM